MQSKEADEFRRIAVMAKVERAEGFIRDYRDNITFYRGQLNKFYKSLGHIAERLGEPEPEEPL